MRAAVLALAAAALIFQLPSFAQSAADPVDISDIDACVAEELALGERGFACIDLISEPCMAEPGGETTAGVRVCMDRSIAAWDAILNREYQKARSALAPDLGTMLRDAQRAWIRFRDKRCALEEAFFEGGTMAGLVYLACYEQETAIRAVDLMSVARQARL